MLKRCFALVLALSCLCAASVVHAAVFPEKAIQVIVPWRPGGGSDISARILSDNLKDILPQPVVVSNIDGAAGLNAATRVFNAAPDGYTLLWEHPGNLTVAPMMTKAAFRWTDFEYVCAIGHSDIVLIVGKDSPWNTPKEAFEAIKGKPGDYRWSMALNAVSHFTFLSISEQAGGLNVVPIPAQGDKGRIISVMGGNSDITTCAWAAAAPYVKSGDIKVLGMATRERSVFAPEIPTLKEQGYDVHCIFLYSMEAPKGTPPEVLKALGDAYKKAVESPRTQEALRNQSIQPYFMGPEATRAHWQEEAGLYEELAKKNKLIE